MRRSLVRILCSVACAAWFIGTNATRAAAPPQIVDTNIGNGIGTSIANVYHDASNIAVSTYVTSVTYSPPRRIHGDDHGRPIFEVVGSIQGIGWGGEWQDLSGPTPIVDTTSHYQYDVPFVLRWPEGFDGTLVHYSHGRTALSLLYFAEGLIGPQDEGRALELEGQFVSDIVTGPERRHAFFAANLGGLKRDGGFSMYATEGTYLGQPVAGSVDAVTTRDLARVAKRLLARFAGRPVQSTVASGHSAGALVDQFIDGGVSMIIDDIRFGTRLYTGGDFNSPYDPSSGLIFDAVVPFAGADVRVNPAFALPAPMLMIGGQAEFSGFDSVNYAARLKHNGVDIGNRLRVYQVRNLPHNWAEIVLSTPHLNQFFLDQFGVTPHADGDRMSPVVAAVLDRAVDWATRGQAAPRSRVDGVVGPAGGGLQAVFFPFANGGTTTLVPSVDDSVLDSYVGFQFDTADPAVQGAVANYAEVLAALGHDPALSLTGESCRLGGYVIADVFSDSQLVPFADQSSHWKNFGAYRGCLEHAVKALADTRLYDPGLAPEPEAAKKLFKK